MSFFVNCKGQRRAACRLKKNSILKASNFRSKQMTRKVTTGILVAVVLTITSCANTLDKTLNEEDFKKVKEIIQGNINYSPMKKEYILDNLSMQLSFVECKGINMDKTRIPTFRTQIDKLVVDYDSIKTAKLEIKETNKKLETFISLKDASTVSINKYKGYLSMTLDFNNQFDREILYIILNYKYVNKYDSEFFNEKSKLTDNSAGDFNGEVQISITEEYNSVTDFMWSEVPFKARKELRDQLGKEEADKKVQKDFLMAGLKVSTSMIVFKDNSELVYQNADWEYLEE